MQDQELQNNIKTLPMGKAFLHQKLSLKTTIIP